MFMRGGCSGVARAVQGPGDRTWIVLWLAREGDCQPSLGERGGAGGGTLASLVELPASMHAN